MQDHSSAWDRRLNAPLPPRVAVVGSGIAGLSCARALRLRGCDPVVFEADARLAALHPWTVAATPAEEERNGKAWKQNEDEADVERTLKLMGAVGVPSMAALAVPIAHESSELTTALRAVRYGSRWVLLLGTERPVPLPGYREFQGSPIERVAAMNSKPGRLATGVQRCSSKPTRTGPSSTNTKTPGPWPTCCSRTFGRSQAGQ